MSNCIRPIFAPLRSKLKKIIIVFKCVLLPHQDQEYKKILTVKDIKKVPTVKNVKNTKTVQNFKKYKCLKMSKNKKNIKTVQNYRKY